MKLRHRLLRLRLLMSKVASERYIELQEQQQLIEISLKAQAHHEREAEILELVSQKAEAHHARNTTRVVKAGDAKRIGDKVILTRRPVDPNKPRATSMTGSIRVEEADMSPDQFKSMLDKRHTLIKQAKDHDYQQRTRKSDAKELEHPKTATIAPRDALHFMATGKIPVRTRAELKEIVDMGDAIVEEVEVSDDAAAMLYLSKRNNRA